MLLSGSHFLLQLAVVYLPFMGYLQHEAHAAVHLSAVRWIAVLVFQLIALVVDHPRTT